MIRVLHPSLAHRWARCPAAPRMSEHGTETESTSAAEGKAAAWLAEMVLTGQVWEVGELIDRRDPDGYAITEEIADNTASYIEHVQNYAAMPHIEELLPSQLIAIGDVRPDAWWYSETTETLEVVDLKYGFRPVEVVGNYQLLLGAWAAVYQISVIPRHVNLTIVQPRNFTGGDRIQTWSIDYETLDFQIRALYDLALATQNDAALAIAGETQCRYCPALTVCPAARAEGLTLMDIAEQGAPEFTDDLMLRAEQVQLKRSVEIAKMRIESIESHLISAIQGGKPIPGIGIKTGHGNRKWKLNPEQLAIAAEMHGIELFTKKPITPAAAERLGLPEAVMAVLTTRPQTGAKIVDLDLTSKAKETFK